ncbi:chorismate-binding protein, partial [bacterium]|nr:chorismate-binding protein [bacterium]
MNISVIELNLAYKPVQLFYMLKDRDYFCFLDSSLGPGNYSKFSYIAVDPEFILKSYGFKNYFTDLKSKTNKISNLSPLQFLNKNISEYISFNSENQNNNNEFLYLDGKNNSHVVNEKNENDFFLPDFKCGFIGYFSYDLKNFLEQLPQNSFDDLNLPSYCLLYFSQVLAYSHLNEKWYLSKIFYDESGEKNYKNADNFKTLKEKTIENKQLFLAFLKNDQLLKTGNNSILIKDSDNGQCFPPMENIRKNIVKNYLMKEIKSIDLKSNFKKEDYINAIKKAKKYIHDGDIYQINLSQRFKCGIPVQGGDLYYILREKNSSPFSSYLNLPEVKIGSSSPERFLYIKNNYIETRPIKGTIPRGKNKEEDRINADKLANSLKDRAELNMIVDLERNDLGKFCSYGSIEVKEHAKIEKYARVIHSVSTVNGRIKKGISFSDIIKAAFP